MWEFCFGCGSGNSRCSWISLCVHHLVLMKGKRLRIKPLCPTKSRLHLSHVCLPIDCRHDKDSSTRNGVRCDGQGTRMALLLTEIWNTGGHFFFDHLCRESWVRAFRIFHLIRHENYLQSLLFLIHSHRSSFFWHTANRIVFRYTWSIVTLGMSLATSNCWTGLAWCRI